MPRRQATDGQIAAALREIEAGTPVSDVCRRLGVHQNTLYRWKKHYGSLGDVAPARIPIMANLRHWRERREGELGRCPTAEGSVVVGHCSRAARLR
jgi:hypothetical protein